ncbi:hypothetical protein B0J12DRAFT_164048 [Macrophomina phaseolina]|uniref:Secreted protein n=1 Tax=Macrophomina phaseolina TaxID=35725 RepID=A0ABQ8GRZ1_9PEZI|nr:hypothetical protein B0J12DRAFT_164048 [Macrophomina phaseolina]
MSRSFRFPVVTFVSGLFSLLSPTYLGFSPLSLRFLWWVCRTRLPLSVPEPPSPLQELYGRLNYCEVRLPLLLRAVNRLPRLPVFPSIPSCPQCSNHFDLSPMQQPFRPKTYALL